MKGWPLTPLQGLSFDLKGTLITADARVVL
jgi:hypothetical protein